MSLHAGSNLRFATAWRTHSADEHSVNKCTERMFAVLEIVPATLVEHLTQDLNWRLSSVLFNDWHVEIIDKNDNFLAESGSKNTVSSFIEFAVDDVLNLIAVGLCGKANLDRLVLSNF